LMFFSGVMMRTVFCSARGGGFGEHSGKGLGFHLSFVVLEAENSLVLGPHDESRKQGFTALLLGHIRLPVASHAGTEGHSSAAEEIGFAGPVSSSSGPFLAVNLSGGVAYLASGLTVGRPLAGVVTLAVIGLREQSHIWHDGEDLIASFAAAFFFAGLGIEVEFHDENLI